MTVMLVNVPSIPNIIFQTTDNEIQIPARSTISNIVVVFNNYTSNESNFDSFAKKCNNVTQFETFYYSIALNFKSKLHPIYQYTGSDSTSNTPYDTPFYCIES
jgi:hypothetical protein